MLGCFFPRDLVTRHFINLYLTMALQYLKSTLHTEVVATYMDMIHMDYVREPSFDLVIVTTTWLCAY